MNNTCSVYIFSDIICNLEVLYLMTMYYLINDDK